MARTNALIALLFVLFASTAFAYWSEKIDVYVIGRDGRALSNATVTVVYQSTSCSNHAQIEKRTNGSGIVHFEFVNTVDETFPSPCIERSYLITASDAGFMNSTEGNINNSDKRYFISLSLAEHIMTVFDGSGRVLPGATATFANTTFTSDSSGIIRFSLPIGIASDVLVGYGGVVRTLSINPSDSNSTTVSLPVYDLKVSLFDDLGRGINGTVSFGDRTELSTIGSPAQFPRFAEEIAVFNITTSGRQKFLNVSITSDTLDVYFDLNAPSIRDVRTTVTGRNDLTVSAAVADDGTYASGLVSNPMLSYSVGTGYIEMKMFPAAANTFEATIPANGANVSFTVTAADRQNNVKHYDGSYSFGGGDSVEGEQKPTLRIEPVQLIGVFVFVIVIVFIYQRIRQQS